MHCRPCVCRTGPFRRGAVLCLTRDIIVFVIVTKDVLNGRLGGIACLCASCVEWGREEVSRIKGCPKSSVVKPGNRAFWAFLHTNTNARQTHFGKRSLAEHNALLDMVSEATQIASPGFTNTMLTVQSGFYMIHVLRYIWKHLKTSV